MLIDSGDTRSRAREEQRLFRAYRRTGDPAVRAQLAERFLPLARSLARRYEHGSEPLDDLVQVASLGLVKAIERYDPERGIAFSTYAVPTIHGEIKRHFRDRAWALRVPRDLQELALRVERVVADLTADLGHQPSVDDVAEAIGTEPEHVLEAKQAGGAYRTASLDAPRAAEDDATPVGDAVGTVDHGYASAEHRAGLQALMRSLTLRERNVITLRFEHDLTQAEIGTRIGLSQMQVSRILRHSLARLRAVADSDGRP